MTKAAPDTRQTFRHLGLCASNRNSGTEPRRFRLHRRKPTQEAIIRKGISKLVLPDSSAGSGLHRQKPPAGGTYQQVGISAGMPTAAQAPAPTPTETTEVARINKGIKKLWWRYKAGNHGNATPATSPTPPSEAAVEAARHRADGGLLCLQQQADAGKKENYEDPWANAAKDEKHEPYDPLTMIPDEG
jgi:hypothetical protein